MKRVDRHAAKAIIALLVLTSTILSPVPNTAAFAQDVAPLVQQQPFPQGIIVPYYYVGPCAYLFNFGLLDLAGACPIKAPAPVDNSAAPARVPYHQKYHRRHSDTDASR